MEISEIINYAFKSDKEINYDINLSDDLINLEYFNKQDILDIDNKTLKRISEKISHLINSNEKDNIKIEEFASLINLELLYFNKAIKEENDKFLLIFFILIKLSKIPFSNFYDNDKINNESILKATELIFPYLNHLDIKIITSNCVLNKLIDLNFNNNLNNI